MGNNESTQSTDKAPSHTERALSAQNQDDIVAINVKTNEYCKDKKFQCNFVIYALYSNQEKLSCVLNQINQFLTHKYQPIKLKVCSIYYHSFTGYTDMVSLKDKSITTYDRNDIINIGLSVYVEFFAYTQEAENSNNINEIVAINVMTNKDEYDDKKFESEFILYALYSKQQTMCHIFTEVTKQINHKFKPIKLKIYNVCGGFTGYVCSDEMDSITNKFITDYSKSDIDDGLLSVSVYVSKYEHKVKDVMISCEYMNKLKSNDPLHCPVYYGMKENYEYSTDNLQHIKDYIHFRNEFEEKPQCKYGQECKAYIRQETNGNRLDDECHMKIYRHPPRTRNIKLAQNINSLIINKTKTDNHDIMRPSNEDNQKYEYNDNDGYLKALIEEIVNNGFKNDLCLECGPNDECKHDDYSILKIVNNKMNHNRHKVIGCPLQRDHMLSLILYTGCDCNYDLCKEQRNGNYEKWKWFDYCLYRAIWELSDRETGSFHVYSGLNKVKLNQKDVESGYFVTYASSSWRKEIAKSFVNEDGMMIQIDKAYKNDNKIFCCDVSWISKFPDECEILFARTDGDWTADNHKFKCVVLDESNGIQTILLKT